MKIMDTLRKDLTRQQAQVDKPAAAKLTIEKPAAFQSAAANPLRNNQEWWSKLTDGVLPAVILILLWMMIALVDRPIQLVFGMPGLLVYDLGLLAVAMFALQQALHNQHSETLRTWYGIVGGFLSWAVVEVSSELGVSLLPNLASLILLIMVSLIITLLWRSGLPLGARFFCLTFMLNWTVMVYMKVSSALALMSPIFTLTFRATGYLAAIALVLTLVWLLFQSRRRSQRLTSALYIWFMVSLMMYVFRGALF